jgi:hypothetical protein
MAELVLQAGDGHVARLAHESDPVRSVLEKWRAVGVYPYDDDPASEAEQVERAVFDVVSGAVSAHIPKKDRVGARLTLTLLRDAIRREPEKLAAVLREVASLESEDLDTLVELLNETTLAAIIKSANTITSRNKFLLGLEHLLFDPDDSAAVGERDHLHRILEEELWIFGEGYHMMNSEKGFTQVLRPSQALRSARRRHRGKTLGRQIRPHRPPPGRARQGTRSHPAPDSGVEGAGHRDRPPAA